jgi:hypothetical protein
MAIKRIYFGSLGPHLYNDTETIDDADGLFPGATRDALTTDGDISVAGDLTIEGAFYLGSPVVDGTWKFVTTGNKLLVQRREGGNFVTKGQFTP